MTRVRGCGQDPGSERGEGLVRPNQDGADSRDVQATQGGRRTLGAGRMLHRIHLGCTGVHHVITHAVDSRSVS